ncbi:MAG: hypothetical protein Q8R37_00890 [Nanoarchaeota archaeon]|nr:hypothetical protein [Nanoarchaeota archaeon]
MKEIDYVELYAQKVREDSSLFTQQKRLIEAQLQGSSSLFKKMFSGDFKVKARNYLRGRGLI